MNAIEVKLYAAARKIIARMPVAAVLGDPPTFNAETNATTPGASRSVTTSPIIDRSRAVDGEGDTQSTAKAYMLAGPVDPAVGGTLSASGRLMSIVSVRRLSAGEGVQAWEVGLADA